MDNEERKDELKENWRHLILQNLEKASYLCTGTKEIPSDKKLIAQEHIFARQEKDYYSRGRSIILNSFPLFLFDFYEERRLFDSRIWD